MIHDFVFLFEMVLPLFVARKLVLYVTNKKRQISKSDDNRELLVDVSLFIERDAGTGIQRVVRVFLEGFEGSLPNGYTLRPVFCTKDKGFRYVETSPHNIYRQEIFGDGSNRILVNSHTIFLGLDLNSRYLWRHKQQLISWKKRGAKLNFILYDLLPLQNSRWFSRAGAKNFKRWLRTVTIYSNSVYCISDNVMSNYKCWLSRKKLNDNAPQLSRVYMGADFSNCQKFLNGKAEVDIYSFASNEDYFLMVGTLEPRKGYLQILRQVSKLWNSGYEFNLIIVGQTGWKSTNIVAEIEGHNEFNSRLIWLKSVTDDLLQSLYEMSLGVIVASLGEGYGLPVVEAMQYRKPIFIRNLPIFREVVGNYDACFFDNEVEIVEFVRRYLYIERHGLKSEVKLMSWSDSVNRLKASLFDSAF